MRALNRKLLTSCLLTALVLSALNTKVRADINVWTSRGPFGGNITFLALAPSDSRILYAGTNSGGIFKSTDQGKTWALTGLRNQAIRTLAVDPLNADII